MLKLIRRVFRRRQRTPSSPLPQPRKTLSVTTQRNLLRVFIESRRAS